jgi:hypothetical protein
MRGWAGGDEERAIIFVLFPSLWFSVYGERDFVFKVNGQGDRVGYRGLGMGRVEWMNLV